MADSKTMEQSKTQAVDHQNRIERIHLELGKLNSDRLERVERYIAFERSEEGRTPIQSVSGSSQSSGSNR